MDHAQQRRRFRWLVPAMSIAMALLASETTLRLIGYTGTNDFRWAVFDEEFGQVDRDKVPWVGKILSRSFAESRLPIWEEIVSTAVPEGKTRILFIGDSDTYGAGFSTRRQAFPHQFLE